MKVLLRHHQGHIQVLLQCFSDTIKDVLKGVIQLDVIGNAELSSSFPTTQHLSQAITRLSSALKKKKTISRSDTELLLLW
jgi:hypothetical protein